MREFPSRAVPYGWFIVGWATDFPSGQTVSLSYFDQELVAYRGASGQLRVFDAYCPHMGAHLGEGGCVEGDGIRCPFHGWLFDASGRNTEIPYSTVGKMDHLGLKRWESREQDGLVLLCHSPDGSSSRFPLPDTFVEMAGDTWEPCPETTKTWRNIPMPVQVVAENAVDGAHFQYVHRAGNVGDLSSFSEQGWVFDTRIDLEFGGDRGGPTWATPHGPVKGWIETSSYGVGIGWTRLVSFDDIIYVMGSTPVTPTTADLRSTTWVARKRSDGSDTSIEVRDKWVKQQNAQVDADIRIWTSQSYVHKPPLAKEEFAATRAVRKWAKQFYPAGSAPVGTEEGS